MNIGNTIRNYRKKCGLTQEQVAIAVGYQNQQFQSGKVVMLILI